jgi:branched-chain amino acid transport system permease protein
MPADTDYNPAVGDSLFNHLCDRIERHRVVVIALSLLILPWLMPDKSLAVSILIFGLFAVGFNLLFGYTGMLSFGHAAFFGGGAYGAGIAIAHFGLNWLAAIGVGIAVAGVLAILIGLLSIRSHGIYFTMITLALAQLVYYIFYQAKDWTGGENGLRGLTVSTVGFGPYQADFLDPTVKYYIVCAFTVLALWLFSRILASPFGGVLEAIRENENRARACGYNIMRTKLLAFILSGLFCGLAGALYALHISIVPINLLDYQTSGIVVMMALMGGRRTLFGPFIGAVIFLFLRNDVSSWLPHWQIVAGTAFVVFVLFFPRGVWGSLVGWVRR